MNRATRIAAAWLAIALLVAAFATAYTLVSHL